MGQFTIRGGLPGHPPVQAVECGEFGATVKNNGPNTAYYRDEQPVDASTNDGSIASGATVTLYGAQYFTVDEGASASSVDSASLLVTLVEQSSTSPVGPGLTAYEQLVYAHEASVGARVVEGENALQVIQDWNPDFDRGAGGMNCRSDVGVGSNNQLFSGSFVAANYAMQMRVPFPTGRGRVPFKVNFVHDTAARFLRWGLHSEAAVVADGAAPASAIECILAQAAAGNATMSVVSAAGLGITDLSSNVPADIPTGVYQAYMDVDDGYITFSFAPSDYSWMMAKRVVMPATRPTFLMLYNGDARGVASGGSSFGPIAAIAAKASAKNGVVGIEDGGPKIQSLLTATHLDRSLIVWPSGDLNTERPVLLYEHGAGSNPPFNDALQRPMIQAFHAAGFIIADGLFGDIGTPGTVGSPVTAEGRRSGYFNWGSVPGMERLVKLYEAIRERGALGPVYLLGVSMGGLLAFRALAESRIPNICGVAGIQPVTSLTSMVGGSHGTNMKKVWQAKTDGSNFAALTAPYDPDKLAGSAFRPVHGVYMRGSVSDSVVPKGLNMDAMATKLTAAGITVTTSTATGDHGDASHFTDYANLVAHAQACVAAGGI